MSGLLGYEIDLTQLTTAEKTAIKEQIHVYKQQRHLLQFGRFVRLLSPFEGNDTAWMYISQDRSEAMVFYFRVLAEASAPLVTLKLQGLDAEKQYASDLGIQGGDELMQIGFYVDPHLAGDYASQMYHFKAIDKPEM